MLDQHLIAALSPLADPVNIVLWKDYRVTVLQDRLFRIEKSENGKFRDKATQTVWFRNMPPQEFTVTETQERLVIGTPYCSLLLYEKREDCRIVINGEEKAIGNEGNLLGTFRTLDGCNGNVFCGMDGIGRHTVTLENGVCSQSGIAVFDDAQSLSLGADGKVLPEKGDGSDEYIFAYGKDYRAAVRALYLITGNVPMLPRYALGNWWSRFHVYTDKEYLRVMNGFSRRGVPFTVATIDMDWHYSDTKEIDEKYHITENNLTGKEYVGDIVAGWNYGWTGYSWNERLFPDYKKFLRQLKERGYKITLNLHPADGVRFWETQYTQMAQAVGMDAASNHYVPFRVDDDKYINAYFLVLLKPYENDGVEFWWIDWQQGEKSNTEGLDPLWALNHYHYYDAKSNHDYPIILSRYAGIGSHRYPIGFSGDTYITWDTLAYLPYFTLTASNIGYTWWSHDIGGHMMGEKDDELFVRHVQFGVFSPINRLHCTADETVTKEPFAYLNGTGLIVEEFLRFRHKMIPYLYSAAYRTHAEGIALVEPLYYRNDTPQAYGYKNEYYFGSELLVAPVTQKAEADKYARVKVWLPKGTWTDIFTGDRYEVRNNGEEKTLLRTLDSIPVLAKSGAILPLSADKGNGCDNPTNLEVWAYEGDGEFSLYEDSAERTCVTVFKMTHTKGKQVLEIVTKGDSSILLANRVITVLFKDIADGAVKLFCDGERIETQEQYELCTAVSFDFDPVKNYKIEIEYPEQTELERLKSRAKRILTETEGKNIMKEQLCKKIIVCESKKEFLKTVGNSEVSQILKARLVEL